MDILSPRDWPYWAHALRMGLTILITAGCGAHAWSQLRDNLDEPASLRWVLGLYSLAFMFAAWANSVLLLVTLFARDYKQGPYHVGTFTLLLIVAYIFTVSFRSRTHVR